MYSIVDKNLNKIFTSISLPKNKEKYYYEKDILPWTVAGLSGNLVKKPQDNKIAYFSSKGALIQFLSIDEKSKVTLDKEKFFYLPRFKVLKAKNFVKSKPEKDDRYGFNDVACTDKRIYALYNGNSSTTDNIADLSGDLILVYDWEGNPDKRIQLDHKCYSISIDPKNPNILYGLSAFEDIGIYRYHLE